MDLEKLKASRAKKERVDFPVSEKELCDRLEVLYTGAINDVLREMNLLHQTLPSSILPLKEDMIRAGIAFTVKGSKNLTLENEMEQRAQMLEAIQENSMVVWDTSGDDESAQWGEVMTMASIQRGCRGAVVDGGIRDTKKVLSQNFPVFARYRTSNGMLGRFRMIGYQVPIQIGNVLIHPGDVVFGDIDGVIVIPREIAYPVLTRAEAIKGKEGEIKEWVKDGMSPTEVIRNGGYF